MRLQSKLNQTVTINGYKPFNIDIERVYIHDNGIMSGSFVDSKIAMNKSRVHVVYSHGVWKENQELNKAVKFVKRAFLTG